MNKLAQWCCFLTVIRDQVQAKPAEESFSCFSERIILRLAPGFDFIRRGCVKKIKEITNRR